MTQSDSVSVHINGKDRYVPRGLTVSGLLEHLGLNPALVVVELNREILERSRFEDFPVQESDVLELVHFVGGG